MRLDGAERKAYNSLNESNYIRARKEGEEIIAENPNSFMGNYVLGSVFLHGEGNLLRGLQFHKQALRRFEEEYCEDAPTPRTADLQKWHQRLLIELADIYAELDDRPKQLLQLEQIEKIYNISMEQRKVWALMKLERLEEARSIATRNLTSPDEYSRTIAYNDLIAIEDSEYNYLASYEIGKRGTEINVDNSCVVLSNLARASLSLLRIDEAIDALRRAKRAKEKDCPMHPDTQMLRIYTQMGEYQKAISTAKSSRAEPPTKRMRVQTEKDQRAAFADLFFSMGYVAKGYDLMKTVVQAPDRQGYNSYSKEKYFLSNMVPYIAMLNTQILRLHEQNALYKALNSFSYDYFKELFERNKAIRELNMQLWKAQQVMLFHALNPATLKGILIPFHMIDNLHYQFAFIDAIGLSTSELLLSFEEQSLNEIELKAVKPNSMAIRAYIAWRRNDDNAVALIDEALKTLPHELNLTMQLLKLIKADILYREGAHSDAYSSFHEILDKFPAAFRVLEIPLPISFSAEQYDKDFADAILKTKRFLEDDNSPFLLSIEGREDVQICLQNRNGHRYSCSSKDEKDIGLDDKARRYRIADNFLHSIFTPRVDLTQSDINSLDGSPIRIGADRALEELLD